MNPFDYMAKTLAHSPTPESGEATGGSTKTNRMRERLTHGRCYAREMAAAAGVGSAMVVPLLKADLASGRVRRLRDAEGRQQYELDPAFNDNTAMLLRAAVALLRRHGFRCTGPCDRRAAQRPI